MLNPGHRSGAFERRTFMTGEYKVYPVEGGYQIFWCPSAPVYYTDRIPYDGKVYSKRQAAYRRARQLTEGRSQHSEKATEEVVA
jgi:hypothetical protein